MGAPDVRTAALHRDGALRRLRRSTRISVVASLALGGAFAAVAAGSTHPKKVVRVTVRHAPAAAAALTAAPVPPLVAVQGASESAPAPAPAPAPPAAAPAPTYQQPVVVSGGS